MNFHFNDVNKDKQTKVLTEDDGFEVGKFVGVRVGMSDGDAVGLLLGLLDEGFDVGDTVGLDVVGVAVGLLLGVFDEGLDVGDDVGLGVVGRAVGVRVGDVFNVISDVGDVVGVVWTRLEDALPPPRINSVLMTAVVAIARKRRLRVKQHPIFVTIMVVCFLKDDIICLNLTLSYRKCIVGKGKNHALDPGSNNTTGMVVLGQSDDVLDGRDYAKFQRISQWVSSV